MWRIFTGTALIFFTPVVFLHHITGRGQTCSANLDRAGNVIGKIYAFSTLGAIAGTFMTGFVLISWMGTRNIILAMGIVLMIAALGSGMLFRTAKAFAVFLVVALFLVTGAYCLAGKIPGIERVYYYKESDYYTIKLTKTTSTDRKTPLQAMVLDNLIHSYVALDNPLHIEYEYERIYAEVLRWLYGSDTTFKSLTIGGGGYTFPRYMETTFPAAQIDVVEIDPQVTKVVYEHLGFRNSPVFVHSIRMAAGSL